MQFLKKFCSVLLFLLLVLTVKQSKATHLMGVDINYECTSNCTIRVHLRAYRDCGGASGISLQNFSWGANGGCIPPQQVSPWVPGSGANQWFITEVTPVCPGTITECVNPNSPVRGVEEYYRYADFNICNTNCNNYVLEWWGQNRNNGITSGAASQGLGSFSTTLNPTIQPCNSSPAFNNVPTPFLCQGQPFTFNQGATDPDGDSLSYSLGPCVDNNNVQVNYNFGYSPTAPLGPTWTVNVNPATGDISFIPNPGNLEVGVMCVYVQEWRNGVVINQIVRDMQINVIQCPNNSLPFANNVTNISGGIGQGNSSTGINTGTCLGNTLCFDIPLVDPNGLDTITAWWSQNLPGAQFYLSTNINIQDTITGQNPTATFCWTPPSAGIFSFLVEMKDNACPNFGFSQFTVSIVVSDPMVSMIPEPPRCDTISMCAVASNGVAPFTFNWQGQGGLNSTDSCITHIYPGPGTYPYTLIITDSIGCSDTLVDSVVIANIPIVDAGPDLLYCQSGSDTIGGPSFPNETYQWTPTTGLSDPNVSNPVLTITNPGPGVITQTYTLLATDTVSGCTDEDQMTVTVSFPAQLDLVPTHILCHGTATGSIDMTINNGLAPFTISWTGPNGFSANTEDISNLFAGWYYVSVTDSAGCLSQDSIEITQPPTPLWVNLNPTHVCCNDSSDGAVDLTVTGDTPPYIFNWSTGAQTEDISGLTAGTYYVTVSDSIGCTIFDSVVITEPTPVNFQFNVYDAACNGEANGVIAAHISGGHGNYGYLWTPSNQTSDSVGNLAAGTHVLLVSDTCYGDSTAQIFFDDFEGYSAWVFNVPTGPNGLDRNFWTIDDDEGGVLPPGCAVNGNGNNTLHISSLANPNGGAVYDAGGSCGIGPCPQTNMRVESPFISTMGFANLTLDFDYISLGDALNDNASVWYNDGGGWTQLVASIKSLTCNPNVGQWTNFSIMLPASCNNIPNLQIGFNWTNNDDGTGNNPSVAINDISITAPVLPVPQVCFLVDSAVVGEPTPLTTAMTPSDLLCFGDSNGTAMVTPAGGNGNYGYNWNNGGTTQQISNLFAGMYIVTVTDTAYTPASPSGFLVCTTIDTTFVNEPPDLVLSTSSTPTSCFLGSDGTVSVSVVGGTPGYGYFWQPSGQTTATAVGLPTGAYTVYVTDTNGCVDSATAVITQPSPVSVTLTQTNARCGAPNGTATATGAGGVGGYTYLWHNGQTSQTATGLFPGQAGVTVTDANGCQTTGTIIVGNEPNPDALILGQINLLCFGDSDGEAVAGATGGTGPYTYLWSTGQQGNTATNLPAGTYTVTVTDSFGCQDTASVTITSPPQLGGTTIVQHMRCMSTSGDGSVGVLPTGGTPPYQYQWNTTPVQNTQNATNLLPGIYTVTVTDDNGCMFEISDTVIQIPRPDVTAGPSVSFCDGDGGAQIFGTATGGQAPYYWVWTCDSTHTFCGLDSINDNDPIANPDTSTWYYVWVVDVNGCVSDTDSVWVEVLPKPIVDAGEDIWLCGDSAACQVLQPTITGAAGPYTYLWIPGTGLNDSTILNPCARPDTTTIYTLVVTAGNGCTSDLTTTDTLSTVTVHVNPVPIADAGPDRDICLGDSMQLQGVASGAGPNYTFQWTPSQGLSDTTIASPWASPNITTVYSLVVWSNNCPSYADSTEVRVHTIPTVEAGWDREICLGETTMLDAQAWGDSTATYSFTWTPSYGFISDTTDEDPFVSPDSTTTYYVCATTNWGCKSIWDSATVYLKPTPIAEAGDNLAICGADSVMLNGSYYYTTTDSADPSQVYFSWWPNQWIDDSTSATPTVWPPTSTWYYLTVTHNTCSWTDSVLVTVIPEVTAGLIADTTVICGGDSVQLTSSGGLGGATFTWTPPQGLSNPNIANPMASPDSTTTYTVVVQEGGCDDSASVTIEVIPSPDPSYLSSLPDGCVPHTVNFLQNSANALYYIWDFGDGSPVVNEEFPTHTYNTPGTYNVSLTVVNYGACSETISDLVITVYDTAQVDFTSDPEFPVEMYLPETRVQFWDKSVHAQSWSWNFGDGTTSQEENPVHTYMTPGEYFVTLQVDNEQGCVSRIVHGPYIIITPELFIPNVFSPNEDGINDIWMPQYTGSQPYNLQIFDRWGNMIHETRNKTKGWDGMTLKGKMADSGVYYYKLKIGPKEYAGDVTLVK